MDGEKPPGTVMDGAGAGAAGAALYAGAPMSPKISSSGLSLAAGAAGATGAAGAGAGAASAAAGRMNSAGLKVLAGAG